jgi:hypothetical protein
MEKALILSIVFATAILPTLGARKPSARTALRWTVTSIVIANFVYLFLLLVVMPRL